MYCMFVFERYFNKGQSWHYVSLWKLSIFKALQSGLMWRWAAGILLGLRWKSCPFYFSLGLFSDSWMAPPYRSLAPARVHGSEPAVKLSLPNPDTGQKPQSSRAPSGIFHWFITLSWLPQWMLCVMYCKWGFHNSLLSTKYCLGHFGDNAFVFIKA